MHKNHYFSCSRGEESRNNISCAEKQHVILWHWKFHEKVRGKLENIPWSRQKMVFLSPYRFLRGNIFSAVHKCQPQPWLFSQLWIREVCVVRPQNHEAIQVWGYSTKPKLKFIRAEPRELRSHLPGGFHCKLITELQKETFLRPG